MNTNVLILISDGQGNGRLEISGRLDLLNQFLNTVYSGNAMSAQRQPAPLQSLPARVDPSPITQGATAKSKTPKGKSKAMMPAN